MKFCTIGLPFEVLSSHLDRSSKPLGHSRATTIEARAIFDYPETGLLVLVHAVIEDHRCTWRVCGESSSNVASSSTVQGLAYGFYELSPPPSFQASDNIPQSSSMLKLLTVLPSTSILETTVTAATPSPHLHNNNNNNNKL